MIRHARFSNAPFRFETRGTVSYVILNIPQNLSRSFSKSNLSLEFVVANESTKQHIVTMAAVLWSPVPLDIRLRVLLSALIVTAIPQTLAVRTRLLPQYNITCLGDQYDLTLPMDGNLNPNTVTMQQLCALPQFGGGLPDQNLGGYCRWTIADASHSLVMFEDQQEVSPVLDSPRTLAACQYRCFCNYGRPDTLIQPAVPPYRPQHPEWPLSQTYRMRIDVVDDFDPPWLNNRRIIPGESVRANNQPYVTSECDFIMTREPIQKIVYTYWSRSLKYVHSFLFSILKWWNCADEIKASVQGSPSINQSVDTEVQQVEKLAS